ncbi:anthranilate synthase component I [Peribacillus cavernae]|uniref:Anthranilate synthase component 1 n=1 Tax=Peribacillus cavernae TaxID=1674310 RepID=A0A3S0W8Y5_9BACI|nr:anthranilate synthase component I [Peribacillus cavernae]MDQ0217231.1 anthranilate synthase component 1 [Peribacillus cavernae]RUQ30298.1 anthranilate synthase component I [Peribacillus cavernae]
MSKKLNCRVETLEGDTHTPVSVFQKLTGKKKFLLESSNKHEGDGRYSYLGSNPAFEIRSLANDITLIDLRNNETKNHRGRILDFLKTEILTETSPELPFPFYGGAIGFLGYDVIRQYEEIGEVPPDQLKMPEAHFMVYREVIVFDHALQKIHLVVLDESESELQKRIGKLKKLLSEETRVIEHEKSVLEFSPSMPRERFEALVKEAKESIIAGKIFQIVLSQRFTSKFDGSPFEIYRKLRVKNPSPYMFFLDFEDYAVLGSSPESMMKVRGRKVTLNPIAGTRPRGKSDEEDHLFEKTLRSDEKEIAEHMMLVDLGRNDLGRVSKVGSIDITASMLIERYQYVMHLVSEVSGELNDGISGLDALAVCLPAGTVSGAPKIEAMKIINKLENSKRGLYSGAIGYISYNGSLDMALAIRTMIINDKTAYVQAGAGIVYDSIPEKEYEETINKAKALMEEAEHDFVN